MKETIQTGSHLNTPRPGKVRQIFSYNQLPMLTLFFVLRDFSFSVELKNKLIIPII